MSAIAKVESPPPDETQFGIRQLLAAMWLLACLLGGMAEGVLFLSAATLPIGLIGLSLISGRVGEIERPRRWIATVSLIVCLLLSLAIFSVGTPGHFPAWLTIFTGVLWTAAVFLCDLERRRWIYGAIILIQAFLTFACLFTEDVQSISGNHAVASPTHACTERGVFIGQLYLVTDPMNTPIIEQYTGALPHSDKFSASFSDAHLLIFDPSLPEVLAKLPNDASRKAALSALLDKDNRLRFHQNMILVAIDKLGYPPGQSAELWWEQNKRIFEPEYDVKQAAQRAWGWVERLEASAAAPANSNLRFRISCAYARDQELRYGEDVELSTAWEQLEREMAHSPGKAAELRERNAEMFGW